VVLSVASQDTLALERAADALGHALDKGLQVVLLRRSDSPKHGRLGGDEVRAVEHEHVQVNIQIER
jgi:hypothetical protein